MEPAEYAGAGPEQHQKVKIKKDCMNIFEGNVKIQCKCNVMRKKCKNEK